VPHTRASSVTAPRGTGFLPLSQRSHDEELYVVFAARAARRPYDGIVGKKTGDALLKSVGGDSYCYKHLPTTN
jgi:hypothetical protein